MKYISERVSEIEFLTRTLQDIMIPLRTSSFEINFLKYIKYVSQQVLQNKIFIIIFLKDI